jgi:hypothetical protein
MFWLIFSCLIFCNWKRIVFLSKILSLTGTFLQEMKIALFVPILGALIGTILLVGFVYTNILLLSTQKMAFNNHTYPKIEHNPTVIS